MSPLQHIHQLLVDLGPIASVRDACRTIPPPFTLLRPPIPFEAGATIVALYGQRGEVTLRIAE